MADNFCIPNGKTGQTVLVTGGAGYIGSHTCVKLLEAGKEIVVIDNLSNSRRNSIERIKEITGKDFTFYCDDLRDRAALRRIFRSHSISGVIHFAGWKAADESVALPLKYYDNNIVSAVSLLNAMAEHQVKNLVFSSSAAVYGIPHKVPIAEDFPLQPISPYGSTKLMIENILQDLHQADPYWNFVILRYFNPAGAHPSGLIGEDPIGIPSNLVPYITGVAVGRFEKLRVYGSDYPTKDGTCVRDYIHVDDLAEGHLAALAHLEKNRGFSVFNLGTGIGYSVMEVIGAFSKAAGKEIPYEITGRRAGDIPVCYANPYKAGIELLWKAQKGLDQMCRDSWNWQKKNPAGYG